MTDDRVHRRATVEELQDRVEIEAVLARYARGVDRKDEAMIRSVYHEDAVDNHGSFNGPASAFVTQLMPRLHTMSVCFHGLCKSWIEIRGEVAVSETYFLCFIRMAPPAGGKPRDMHQNGRYLDRLERRDGVWKIAHRQMVVDDTRVEEASDTPVPAAFQVYMTSAAAPDDFAYKRWAELP